MIVWGWSTKEIGTKKTPGKCLSCNSQNLVIVGFQRVFDLFWIPVIPLGKSSCVRCNSCNTSYVHEPSADEMAIQGNSFKTPWWAFSGLVIIVILIMLGYLSDRSTQQTLISFKENPTLGTYFTFKNIDNHYNKTPYVFGRIEKIEESKIILSLSKYAYSKSTLAYKEAQSAKDPLKNLLDSEVFEFSKGDFMNLNIQSIID